MYRDENQRKNEEIILSRMAEAKGWKKAKPLPDYEHEFYRRVARWYEEAYSDDRLLNIFDGLLEEDDGGMKLYEKAE